MRAPTKTNPRTCCENPRADGIRPYEGSRVFDSCHYIRVKIMRKFAFIVFIIAVCLMAAACRADNQALPATQEPPAETVQAELPPSPPEEIQPEPVPPIVQLSARAQYILDAGQFSADFVDEYFIAEHSLFSYGRFTTYTNTALGLVYHYDAEAVDDRRFAGVGRPWVEPPGGMMWAIEFGMSFDMLVIDGCGAQWAREQADSGMKDFIRRWQEWEEYKRERYGDEFEEQVPRWVQSVNENNERLKYYLGDDFEKDFCYIDFLVNPEDIAFWPVQYEAAGRTFTGLQINAVMPWTGFIIGVTHLYDRIDDDVAVVITISVSEAWAGSAARRHMSRITAIPT